MSKASTRKKASATSHADALFVKANKQWDCGKLRSSFRLFLSAAKSGDPSSQHNLGYFYDVGIGVRPNRAAALFWYKRALRSGLRTSASNIGTIFRDEGKTKEALLWFKRAIKLGDGDANLEVAKILLRENDKTSRVIQYLKRTTEGKPRDVTEGSKQEARRLLRQLGRSHTPHQGS